MPKKEVEQQIINVIQLSIIPLTLTQIRVILENRNMSRDDIGDAFAKLADNGKITIDSEMKVGLDYARL